MATTRKSTSVTASELLHAYKDNADAANAKYKGKVLKVTGQVNKCGRGKVNHEGDIVDEAWMDLTAKGETSAGPRLTCRFDAAQMDHTDAAVVGTQVIVQGTCIGEPLYDAELDHCTLKAIDTGNGFTPVGK